MAEQRKSYSKSFERNSASGDIDPLCLYIRQLPIDMSQEDFVDLVTNNGKRATTSVRLFKKPGYTSCYGFVNFVSHEDALNALNELNGNYSSLNLSVVFATKKTDNENKVSSISENLSSFKGKGRGMYIPTNESKNYVNKENIGFTSRGRGQRISLDSPVSRIKIIADSGGRKVTVEQNESECNGQFADDTPRDLDSIPKVPNPFYFCFVCGKEGIYSCKQCRKPYCSKICQVLDFSTHKGVCKRAKELSEKLLCVYKNFPGQNYDSGVSENSNSDPEKLDSTVETKSEMPCKYQLPKTIEKIVLSPGEVELVCIINIESPAKFWIRLQKYLEDFSRMEEKLSSLQEELKSFHSQQCVSPQLICCTLYNSKICRSKVQKVKSQDEILIELLDYGKSVTVEKGALCSLPAEFRSLPAQAISCRLVSDDNEIIQWNEEDTLSFELHTNNKTYKAHIFNSSNEIYDISLINDDGIPLYSILAEERKVISTSLSTPVPTASLILETETDGKPPSIWSKLKPGAKLFLIFSVIDDEGFVWCYLVTGESDLKVIIEIEKLLQNYTGEDATLTIEEDEIAAGFSSAYKQYYRCRILKRMHKSFLVHYIDYGNKEEITRVSSLSEDLLQKWCYLIKCEMPSDINLNEFQKFLGDSGAEVTVMKVDENSAQLSFFYKKKYSLTCYPCYSSLTSENEVSAVQPSAAYSKVSPIANFEKIPRRTNFSKEIAVENTISKVLSPSSSHISPVSKSDKSIENYKKVAEKITVPKVLLPSTNYCVRILFIKTVSELYVQLVEDEVEMSKMVKNLNSFCNSKTNSYIPNTGEIVACKFSDGVWYRGKVLEKRNDNYLVFFIDYGNEDIVSKNNIQILSDKFILPQFSVCVSLSGLKNEDISKSLLSKLLNEDWDMKVVNPNKSPKEVMLFQKNIPITNMIKNKIDKVKCNLKFKKLPVKSSIKICFEDDKYLYVNEVQDLKSLEEMSAKLNSFSNLPTPKDPKLNNVYSGLFVDGLFYRVSIEEAISSDSFKVFFLDYGNYEIVKTCDLRELPDDLFALSVYCIPVQVQNRRKLSLNMDEKYNVEVIDMQGDVQIVKFLDLDKSTGLTTENKVDVKKIDIDTKDKSSLIFKKLPEDKVVNAKVCYIDNKLVYLHQISDLPIVEDILLKLNSSPSELLPIVKPVVNKIYCGLCSDGCWYRVCIEEMASSNTYKVYFLDFGNYETLSTDKLRELPSDLLSIPVCCIPVIVEGEKDLTLNFEKEYKIQVISKEESFQKVKIIDSQEDIKFATKNEGTEETKNNIKQEETEKLPHISQLKKQKLQDGLTEVTFCHLEGDIVYCQLSSDVEHILGVFNSLQKCGREGKAPISISVGDVICAQASDTFYYRACILSDKQAPSYKVLFFDYGNSEYVTGDSIKILPNEFLNFPVFAVPLKIENADSVNDATIFTKPMLVKKINEINGDTYVVKLQLDDEISHTKFSTLKKLRLPDDDISNVSICHIDDGLYYVQPTSNISNLTKLSKELEEAHTFCSMPHSPEEGEIICAKFIDGLWYRSVVKKVYTDKVDVFFIDYGNSDTVSIDDIKTIPQELCSYPVASIPVKFKDEKNLQSKLQKSITTFDVSVCSVVDDIQIVDIASQAGLYDKTESKPVQSLYTPVFISSFTKSSLPLKKSCKVVFKMNMSELYIAVKSDECDEIEKLNSHLQESKTDFINHTPSVGEVLLSKKDNLWHRCAVLNILADDMYKVHFVDLGIINDVQKSAMRNLPDTCKSFPLFAVKLSIESDSPVTVGKCYNVYVLSKNSDDIYNVKVYHQYKYSMISRKELEPRKETDVIFYHKEGTKLFLQDINNIDILAEVQKIITKCSSNSCMPYKPDVGELVCAMSQLDNSWYRGCIEEFLSNDECKVFYIDYGNSENVKKQHLQPMSFALTKFPSLSIPVKLENNEMMGKIELEKLSKVVALDTASNGVQVIKIVTNNEVANISSLKTSKNCDATKKFLFKSCKFVPFNSGEQDIVIYSVDDECSVFCAPFNEENIKANLELITSITEHCNSNGVAFDDSQPEPGEMVLALYSVDNSWYRAVVVESSHPEYVVNFVDFGNIECLNLSSLRKMDEKFLELDIQAHMCSFTGFTYSDENVAKVVSELKTFDVFSYNEPLRAFVKVNDDDITVNVPIITSYLVKKKLVTAVNEK